MNKSRKYRFTSFSIAIVALILSFSFSKSKRDFRQEMRTLVQEISAYSKAKNSTFCIIPQNGVELLFRKEGVVDTNYLNAIDGVGQENVFYGYRKDNRKTSSKDKSYLLRYLKQFQKYNKTILVTDYCKGSNRYASAESNRKYQFLSFQAPDRELNALPSLIHPKNLNRVSKLNDSKNFLYLLNTEKFNNKSNFIDSLSKSEYDLILIDPFFRSDTILTKHDVEKLQKKPNGAKRMVIAYMSIGEAEDYRYYWQKSWAKNPPVWMAKENKNWKGNFKVMYWTDQWKNIIYKGKDAYLDKIISAGFDGVYLDIIDAFEYWEED